MFDYASITKFIGTDLEFNGNETSEEVTIKWLKRGMSLNNIPVDQITPKVSLEAVKINGLALDHHRIIQTHEICLEAVKQNGLALKFVRDEFRTPEICSEAIKQNENARQYIKV